MIVNKNYKYWKYILLGIIATSISTCYSNKKKQALDTVRDLQTIQKEGNLKVATEYNTIAYYVDGDSIRGFHYDLVMAIAERQGLVAEITPVMSVSDRLEGIQEGKYDLIAYDIPTTSILKDSLLLTIPINRSKQVLVQRKPMEGDTTAFINNQLDLAKKTLYVVEDSPALLRIKNLSDEIGDTIYTKEIKKYGSEQLIALVAHKEIDYAVCNENIAQALIDSFPQLDINTEISFNQLYSWAVNKKSVELADSLNTWLESFMNTSEFKKLYNTYYK
ncbi:MAG: transporter substrate-binding domain-containing protein [Bacteroidales bacterium]|nr:transporter substrate-binding domain-containing protein [Bacteroidales bacterium]